jgi:hypothetical protein
LLHPPPRAPAPPACRCSRGARQSWAAAEPRRRPRRARRGGGRVGPRSARPGWPPSSPARPSPSGSDYVSARAPDGRPAEHGRDARARLLVADMDAALALLGALAGASTVRCSSSRLRAAPRPELRGDAARARATRSGRGRAGSPDAPARGLRRTGARLFAETGGVPLVVHRAATARARVTERLAATIEQASAGRGRRAETPLAGGCRPAARASAASATSRRCRSGRVPVRRAGAGASSTPRTRGASGSSANWSRGWPARRCS